jgi:glycine cleavage system transcriptional repressor
MDYIVFPSSIRATVCQDLIARVLRRFIGYRLFLIMALASFGTIINSFEHRGETQLVEKVVISVLGTDRPGIVAAVSRILSESSCNIEDVSQTILQTEFAGIFIASISKHIQPEDLLTRLRSGLESLGLHVLLKQLEPTEEPSAPPASEPFVVTTIGPDRLGLVVGITEVMARFGVNITNLKAIFRGGNDPRRNTMIYEVDVPVEIEHHAFRRDLRERAEELGLDLSLQHRDIFEAIHRV